jgi:hypothetical protein
MAMRGVVEEEVEARIALKMSLSCLIQWFLCNSSTVELEEEGHENVPST